MNIQPIVDAAKANPEAFYVEDDEFILHLPTGSVMLINVLGDKLIGDTETVKGMKLLRTMEKLYRDDCISSEVLARFVDRYA